MYNKTEIALTIYWELQFAKRSSMGPAIDDGYGAICHTKSIQLNVTECNTLATLPQNVGQIWNLKICRRESTATKTTTIKRRTVSGGAMLTMICKVQPEGNWKWARGYGRWRGCCVHAEKREKKTKGAHVAPKHAERWLTEEQRPRRREGKVGAVAAATVTVTWEIFKFKAIFQSRSNCKKRRRQQLQLQPEEEESYNKACTHVRLILIGFWNRAAAQRGGTKCQHRQGKYSKPILIHLDKCWGTWPLCPLLLLLLRKRLVNRLTTTITTSAANATKIPNKQLQLLMARDEHIADTTESRQLVEIMVVDAVKELMNRSTKVEESSRVRVDK